VRDFPIEVVSLKNPRKQMSPVLAQPSQNIPYLDGWRGLAIALLLVGHFLPVPGINLGRLGVHLFFVLSGLLMARILFVKPVPLGLFYKRRIARVFPSVWVFLLAIIAGFGLLGRPTSWSESFAAATFMNNYFTGKPAAAVMPFGHIWSLSVEEHSYVILSLVALAVRARWVRAAPVVGGLALCCAVTAVAYWATYKGEQLGFDRWLRTEVAGYGIFVSSFILLCLKGRMPVRLPWALFGALVAIGVGAHWWSMPLPVTAVVGVGAFALAINLLPAAPPLLQAALSLRPLRQLGIWSFSIYIWQQPFYLYLKHGWASAGLALATGIAGYYLLERPARSWLNRTWSRPQAVPSQTDAYSASYAPISIAPSAGRVVPEATCLYCAPGLSDTPAVEYPGTDPALITNALASGRKS
jgi:peptidoglycan/LPS O-acetylase OafA/YrhL